MREFELWQAEIEGGGAHMLSVGVGSHSQAAVDAINSGAGILSES
jgi:hypothetical protein